MACGDWKSGPTGHLDFEGLTLAGVGPLAFQGPTAAVGAPGCSGDSHVAMRSRAWHVGWAAQLSQRSGVWQAAAFGAPTPQPPRSGSEASPEPAAPSLSPVRQTQLGRSRAPAGR